MLGTSQISSILEDASDLKIREYLIEETRFFHANSTSNLQVHTPHDRVFDSIGDVLFPTTQQYIYYIHNFQSLCMMS